MRDFLVYTSAGLNSNVHLWAKSVDRNYDVWVTNYSDVKGNLSDLADYYNESKGTKFPNLKKVMAEHEPILRQYKAIMVADDDVVINARKLNRMFNLMCEKDLWVVAPAFSRFGKISHETTERKLLTRYRYTNFAEMTCPIIRTDKLLSFMNVYNGKVPGYGVDWWYLNHLGLDVTDKIVISDQDYCINPRDEWKPSRSREIDSAFSRKEREAHWEAMSRQLGMRPVKPVVYRSVPRNPGKVIAALPYYVLECIYWMLFRSPPSKKMKHRIKLALGRA